MYGENKVEKITIRITPEEKEQLKIIAEKHETKVSQLIREAIQKIIKEEK